MARNIRWFFNFMSFKGVRCTVNIYDNDWPEGIVLGLRPADSPFSFSEGDSSDLLNDVLRYTTGYIRIVETGDYGRLDALFPTSTFDRYVEVSYGSTVVFRGYIQVQDFSNAHVANPRVIELPVISQLGLFDKQVFRNTLWLPPHDVTLGAALDVVLRGKTYTYVYFPKRLGYPNTVSLGMSIYSSVLTPWNEDFRHSMQSDWNRRIAVGEKYSYLIECICKAFGLVCHDTPSALVFSAFDYQDEYVRYLVGHMGEAGYVEDAGMPTSLALADYYSLADDNANIQTIQPETGIEVRYEGENNTVNFDFARTYADPDGVQTMPSMIPFKDDSWMERFSLLSLIPVFDARETSISGAFRFQNDDKLPFGTHIVAWNGHEGILMSMTSPPTGTTLFWIRFYIHRRARTSFNFKFDVMYREDGILSGLKTDEDKRNYFNVVFDFTHDDYIQANFVYRWGGPSLPALPSQSLVFIHNITLAVLDDGEPYSKYLFPQAGDSDTLSIDGDVTLSGDTPAISSSITMPISFYRHNDRLIGTSVRSTKITTYPYLFRPRKQLQGKFRINALPQHLYCPIYTYIDKKWRVIAQDVELREDEVILTLQNSSTL
jgi:hypothetical protein